MKDRIKQYIEHKGISAGELALKLDVQRSNISHILNGRNKPGAVFIEKLLLVFTDLNARWLLTGKGEMIEGTPEVKKETTVSLPFTEAPESQIAKPQTVKPQTPKPAEPKIPEPKTEQHTAKANNDVVNKMILVYNDGTFQTFQNRDNK